jgi:hypothetical protein
MNTTIYITREIKIDVAVEYTPAVKATHLDPPVAPDIQIITAYDQDVNYIELTDSEVDEVREIVLQDPPQRDYDEE